MLNVDQLIGVGLYTVSEAAKLTGIPAARIRRWLVGYHYRHGDDERWSDPLWTSEIPTLDDTLELGFRDLMELRFVERFVSAGLSLHTVRLAINCAREQIGEERPFSTTRFRTDGRTVFLQISEEAGEPRLIDLLRKQYAFNQVIEPSFKDIDFDGGRAARWWPLTRRKSIILDPARSFGQPIISNSGVPTEAIANAVKVESSIGTVAKIFEIPVRAVKDAVLFENRSVV